MRKLVNKMSIKKYRIASFSNRTTPRKRNYINEIQRKPVYRIEWNNIPFDDLIGISRILSTNGQGFFYDIKLKNSESNLLLQRILRMPPLTRQRIKDHISIEIANRNEAIHSPTEETKKLFNQLMNATEE